MSSLFSGLCVGDVHNASRLEGFFQCPGCGWQCTCGEGVGTVVECPDCLVRFECIHLSRWVMSAGVHRDYPYWVVVGVPHPRLLLLWGML